MIVIEYNIVPCVWHGTNVITFSINNIIIIILINKDFFFDHILGFSQDENHQAQQLLVVAMVLQLVQDTICTQYCLCVYRVHL